MELTRRSYIVCKINFTGSGFMKSPSSDSHTPKKLPVVNIGSALNFNHDVSDVTNHHLLQVGLVQIINR